jgi:hypothetical protein
LQIGELTSTAGAWWYCSQEMQYRVQGGGVHSSWGHGRSRVGVRVDLVMLADMASTEDHDPFVVGW